MMIRKLEIPHKTLTSEERSEHRLAQTGCLRKVLQTQVTPEDIFRSITSDVKTSFAQQFFCLAIRLNGCTINLNNMSWQPLKRDLCFESTFVFVEQQKPKDIHRE